MTKETHTILIDTGASWHITGLRGALADVVPCTQPIVGFNGEQSHCKEKGTLRIQTKVGFTLMLTDVMYIPGAPSTLVSVPYLVSKNRLCKGIERHSHHELIVGDKLVAKSPLVNNKAYIMEGKIVNPDNANDASTSSMVQL